MAVKEIIEAGGEWLIGLARERLSRLHAKRLELGVDLQQVALKIESGETVLVRSHLDRDLIRITAGAVFPRLWGCGNTGSTNAISLDGQHTWLSSYEYWQEDDPEKRNVTPVNAPAIATRFEFTTAAMPLSRWAKGSLLEPRIRKLMECRLFSLAKHIVDQLRLYTLPRTTFYPNSLVFVAMLKEINGTLYCGYSPRELLAYSEVDTHSYRMAINKFTDYFDGNAKEGDDDEIDVVIPEKVVDLTAYLQDAGIFWSDCSFGPVFVKNTPTVSEHWAVFPGGGYTGSLSLFHVEVERSIVRLRMTYNEAEGFDVAADNLDTVPHEHITTDFFSYRQNQVMTPLTGTIIHHDEYTEYNVGVAYGAWQLIRETNVSAIHQEAYHSDCGLAPPNVSIPATRTVVGGGAEARTAYGYKDTLVHDATAGTLSYKGVPFVNSGLLYGWMRGGFQWSAISIFSERTGGYTDGIPMTCGGDASNSITTEYHQEDVYTQFSPEVPSFSMEPYELFDLTGVYHVPPMGEDLCVIWLPRTEGEDGICYTRVSNVDQYRVKQAAYRHARYGDSGATEEEIALRRDELRALYTVLLNNFASLDLIDLATPSFVHILLP